jgi:hypothetical protein
MSKPTKAQIAAAATTKAEDLALQLDRAFIAAETAKRKIRQPVKALNKPAEVVAANAKAERERKSASKKALRTRLAYDGDKKPTKPVPPVKSAEAKAAEHEAYLTALRIDAEALGVDPDTYVAEQLADTPKTGYVGPMLALRTAVKTYVKAANGQPCCGDDLATICGAYPREAVVAGLIAALGLGSNPYMHLNPGQQSMNLRNKARTALKNGVVTADQIRTALAAA